VDPGNDNQWVDLYLDESCGRFRQAGGRTFKVFDGSLTDYTVDGGNTGGALDNFRCVTDIPTQLGELPGDTAPADPDLAIHGHSLVFIKVYVYRGQNLWTDFFSLI